MDNLSAYPLTLALGLSNLAAGTTTTFTTTGTLAFAINSIAYSKAAVTNQATPTLDANTGLAFKPLLFPSGLQPGQCSVFVWALNAAGTYAVVQGSVENLDSQGAVVIAPQYPVVPDTMCPVGSLLVRLGPTAVANWTLGVNNLSSVTGVTYTFASLIGIPARPRAS